MACFVLWEVIAVGDLRSALLFANQSSAFTHRLLPKLHRTFVYAVKNVALNVDRVFG
jgi:hypothetical protein